MANRIVKNIKKMKSVFCKYLLSYIFILMIPVLVVGLTFYNDSINTLQEELIENQVGMLTQIKQVIDNEIVTMVNISCQIESNSNLSPYYVFQKPYNGITAIEEIKKYSRSSNLINEIILYYFDEDMMYSNNTSYTVSRFVDKEYLAERLTQKYYKTGIYGSLFVPSDELFSDSKKDDSIIYVSPIPNRSENPYAAVFFVLSKSGILKLLDPISEANGGATIVENAEGEIIVCSTYTADENLDQYNEVLDIAVSKSLNEITAFNHKYLISSVLSERTDWTFYIVAEKQKVLARLYQAKRIGAYSLLLVLVMGSFFIYLVMYLNYNPLKRLISFIENTLGGASGKINDIEAIRVAVEKISTGVQGSEFYRNAQKDYLLLQLLHGNIASPDEFNSKGFAIGLSLTKRYYSVSIIQIESQSKTESKKLIRDIEDCISGNIRAYARENMETGKIVLIISMDINDMMFLENKLNHVKDYVKSEWGIISTIGVGNIYDGIEKLGKSYIESYTALDYRFIKGKDSVIVFNKVFSDVSIDTWLKSDVISDVATSIKLGDSEALSQNISRVTDTIKDGGMSLSMARCICYDLVNTIIRTTYEMGKLQVCKNMVNIFELTGYETVEELIRHVEIVSRTLCDEIKRMKESHNYHLIKELIGYIKNNATDENFSINKMAEEMSLSPSYMSRYFKEQTGSTILQYINNERILLAHQLLVENHGTVDEIAKKLGYCTVSGFVKMFKKTEGISPGQYRRLQKKN